MAPSFHSKTLKRKASNDLENPRLKNSVQLPLDTPSNILADKSDIEQRVANYLERNTPREGENGEHKAHQDESQQLLRELLVAYRAKYDQLNETKNSARQIQAEEQEAAMQIKKFLGEPRRISTMGIQDMLESEEGKDDANEALLRIERVMNNIHDSTLDNPYALVLLDGDGYLFNEDLVRQGLKGGEIAAERLEDELRIYFERNNFKGQRGWRIVVFIFASLDGLAHKMKKSGRTSEAKSFRQFTIGINQSEALINVVDVGTFCKEGTDYKIRTFFELLAPDMNLRCRHLVLGCSHDKGYLRMLARYKHKTSYKDSITLLETKVTAEGFQHMSFKKLYMHNLLISSTILNNPPDSIRQTSAVGHQLVPAPKIDRTQTATKTAIYNTSQSPQQSSPTGHHNLSSMSVRKSSGNAMSLAPTMSLRTPLYPRTVAINGSNQRVDQALPQPTTQVAGKAAQRLRDHLKSCTENGSAKPCQEWYLAGLCAYGNSCALDHHVQFDQAQLEELARMIRQHPCPIGSTCRDNNCVLGHSCPYDADGRSCAFQENCRLIQFHGMDSAIVEIWDPTGNAVQVGSGA